MVFTVSRYVMYNIHHFACQTVSHTTANPYNQEHNAGATEHIEEKKKTGRYYF